MNDGQTWGRKKATSHFSFKIHNFPLSSKFPHFFQVDSGQRHLAPPTVLEGFLSFHQV
jgi:hypothetical protein